MDRYQSRIAIPSPSPHRSSGHQTGKHTPPERRAVICDFGLAAQVLISPPPFNGGTTCYITPEYVFDGQRGFEGDIWAFGVTMFFVLGLSLQRFYL